MIVERVIRVRFETDESEQTAQAIVASVAVAVEENLAAERGVGRVGDYDIRIAQPVGVAG